MKLLTYTKQDTFVHHLSGVTKLFFFLLWCFVSGLTYDTRVLAVMIAVSMWVIWDSRAKWEQFAGIAKLMAFFMIINVVCIFFFSPYIGCEIYNSRTDLLHLFGNYTITAEQLFYSLNVMMKYFTIVPSAFAFMVSTDPSEFAASMNGVGIKYTAAYSVSIALRYIPNVQSDYRRIKNAQEARGIEMSGKAKPIERLKRTSSIIFPMLFSSMDRIDVVSNAMQLRGFGKKKKRTWYAGVPLSRADKTVIVLCIAFSAAALWLTFYDGNRFYNPFQ